MGEILGVRPVLCVMALFSRHAAALQWARHSAEEHWGPIQLASSEFVFDDTDYYHATMGRGLRKQLLAFRELIDAEQLPVRKRQTNQWEAAYASSGRHSEPRPLNLDPGYLTEAKLVLATTKDRAHRIYLEGGIFAECTLHFHRRGWRTHPWTYPDYAKPEYHEFLTRCRDYLRQKLRQELRHE